MAQEILVTISQVAVTLAGFSGVIFALGNRSGRSLTAKEESGLTHMLLTSFGPVLISLSVLVLLNSGIDSEAAWRISCAATGVFCFAGSARAMMDEVKGRHTLPRIFAWLAPIGAQFLGIFNFVVSAGIMLPHADVILEATLIYLLWISIMYFISLLKQDQTAN